MAPVAFQRVPSSWFLCHEAYIEKVSSPSIAVQSNGPIIIIISQDQNFIYLCN